MHPNALFRHEDRAVLQALIEEAGFGMVYAQGSPALATLMRRFAE